MTYYLPNDELYTRLFTCALEQSFTIEYFNLFMQSYLQTFTPEAIIAKLNSIKQAFSQQYKAKRYINI